METAYRSEQRFGALWTVMPLSSLAIAVVLWLTGDPNARLGIGIVLSTTVFTLVVMGRLVVQIRGDHLQWHFGWLGIPRWALPLAHITACELARGSAAGAGIKGTRQQREYTAVMGSPGVRLTLQDGSRVFLGSPEPERLRAFLEARLPSLPKPAAAPGPAPRRR